MILNFVICVVVLEDNMVQHLNSVGDLETTATNNGKSKAIPLPPPPSSQFTNGNGEYKGRHNNFLTN